MDTNYFSVAEVAKKLNVSSRTIQREIKRGNLTAMHVGKKLLVSKKALQGYLKQEKASNTELVSFLRLNYEAMVNQLQKFVASPSEMNQPESINHFAHQIRKLLQKQGIRVVVHGRGEGSAVHASFGYAEKGILLNCPLDTTSIGNVAKWKHHPYDGVISGGKMYGRGTADSKSGIVCILYTLIALKKFVSEKEVRVEVIFDGGEHSGAYLGMKRILERGLPVGAGIIGYAGDQMDIQIGCRGYHRFTIKTKGESSHTGSRSRYGLNAINLMAKLIRESEKHPFPSPKNKLFYFGSRLTFSLIAGGQAINIVPDECTARVDVRTLPEQHKAEVESYLSGLIRNLKEADPSFRASIRYDLGEEGYVLEGDNKLLSVLQSTIEKIYKRQLPVAVSGPGHIGALLAKKKIPMIIWGPKGGNIHSYDEYVEIDSLSKTVAVYVDVVKEYFGV